MKLRVRKEDADNVRVLESMEGLKPFERPDEIVDIFKGELGPVN
jgi:flavoprotein